jgi:hypothetical protein
MLAMVTLAQVAITKPDAVNIILGQSHFIKTVEDLYEAVVGAVPDVKFGLAFAEASGACKVRVEGTDEGMRKLARENVLAIGAGHVFLIALANAYPVNILNAVKSVPEVCTVFCATANPVEVIVAESAHGRGVLGVIDGARPSGIESADDVSWRKDLLRTIGYKL